MATSLALKRGIAACAAPFFNKLFTPVRSVSATPCVRRSFNTNASQVSDFDDFNQTVDADRRADSSVSRRRDNDFFSDLFDPVFPTRSVSQIFNMMDQFMDSPFISAARGGGLGARRGWYAKEDDDALSLRFDMPGMDKDNVKISVEQNTLIVKAEAEESDDGGEPSRRYSSRIDLPVDVLKLDEIKAQMKNGVLKIVVPKVKPEERKDAFQVQVECQIFNMMDQFMDSPFISAARGGGLGARRGWYAKEDDDALSLRFDMPGMDKDNVKISVEQNTLIVKAEAEESDDGGEPSRRYSSRIDLPVDVLKLDEIKAQMKNGVLKIVVPKVKPEERKDAFQVQVE